MKAKPSVTRSLRQMRSFTPAVRRPALDEATRAELARLAATARAYLAVDNLPAALSALAGAAPDSQR